MKHTYENGRESIIYYILPILLQRTSALNLIKINLNVNETCVVNVYNTSRLTPPHLCACLKPLRGFPSVTCGCLISSSELK